MIFRRIRGRIVPIKEREEKRSVARDVGVGVASVGAGGSIIAAGTSKGRDFQSRVNDALYSFHSKRKASDRKAYIKKNAIPEWVPLTKKSADDVIAVRFPHDMIKKYGPSLSPNFEKKSYIPRGVSIEMADGDFFNWGTRKIIVSSPSEATFLHELGHAQQWEKREPFGNSIETRFARRSASSGDVFIGEAAKAAESRDKIRGAIKRRYFKSGLAVEVSKYIRSNAKARYHATAMDTHATISKMGRFIDEVDAWRRAVATAYKGDRHMGVMRGIKSGSRVARAAVLPITSYAIGIAHVAPRLAYAAAGASAIAYGAYRILRRKK